MSVRTLVIDTNWVLDLWVFDDPRAAPLRHAIQNATVRWLGCAPMRAELLRVLSYPAIGKRLSGRTTPPDTVMALYDRWCHMQPVPPPCPTRCKDTDDQVFIDLSVAHQATLLSKDTMVLRLKRALSARGVQVSSTWI